MDSMRISGRPWMAGPDIGKTLSVAQPTHFVHTKSKIHQEFQDSKIQEVLQPENGDGGGTRRAGAPSVTDRMNLSRTAAANTTCRCELAGKTHDDTSRNQRPGVEKQTIKMARNHDHNQGGSLPDVAANCFKSIRLCLMLQQWSE